MKNTSLYVLIIFICTCSLTVIGQEIFSSQRIQNAFEQNFAGMSANEIRGVINLSDSLLRVDVDKSIELIEIILPYTKLAIDSGNLEIEALSVYAEGLLYTNRLDEIISVLELAIKKLEGQSQRNFFLAGIGKLYQYVGLAYTDKGDYLEAAKNLSQASVYFEKGDDTKNQCAAKYNQANLLNTSGYYKQAESAYLELLGITKNFKVHQVVYNSLGTLCSKQDEYEEAFNYFNKSLELIEHAGEPEMVYLNLGLNYYKIKDYENAKKNLKLAERLIEKKNRTQGLGLVYNALTKVFFANGEYDEAKEYLALMKESVSSENLRELMLIHRMGAQIFEKEGNSEKALIELKSQYYYKDSILNKEKLEAIAEIETKYQTEAKEAENEFLKQEKVTQSAIIENQRIILFASLFGLGLLGLIAFLLYRQSSERKKNNQLLSEKNQKIETLHKELSHRVKNNLAFVSGLMRMQSRRLESNEARQAVKEGESRVEAMSLLHRKLYMQEKSTINIGGYLQELSANLQNTFPKTGARPKIDINVDKIEINGESAVRIGLIVNELVTNSFKYAFGNEPNPMIEIGLKEMDSDVYRLIYQDNGIGLPTEFDITKSDSLGLKLIHTLTQQLKGNVFVENRAGAYFQFDFKEPKIAV